MAFFAFSCAGSKTQSVREKKGDIYFTAGTEALMEGRYTEALASLQESAKFLPDSPNVWTNLGLAYAGKEEYQRAEESWKKALKLDPKWSDARANLGALYVRQRRLKEGEKILREVSQDLVYRDLAKVHFNLSRIYAEWRKPLLEEQQLRLAIKNNNSHCAAWFYLGLLQKEKGDFSVAAESLDKSVQGICFNNPQAHYEISSLLIKAKDTTQARVKLLEIIQLFPQSEWARKAEVTLNMIR